MSNFVFYRGASQLDGAPIMAVAVLRSRNSANSDLVQTFIMRDDMHPVAASRTGADQSVCGVGEHACEHRGVYVDGFRVEGTRTCYVNMNPLASIYRAHTADSYEDLTADVAEQQRRVAGRKIRLGAYGDPAAVPHAVWIDLLATADSHTGYTHQWRLFPEFRSLCMASVDSVAQRDEAKTAGWRTFRVAAFADWQRDYREALCPKSAEFKTQHGHARDCGACMSCHGADPARPKQVDIVIPAHGSGKRNVKG